MMLFLAPWGCSPSVDDECVRDADCLAFDPDLVCFDNLCVLPQSVGRDAPLPPEARCGDTPFTFAEVVPFDADAWTVSAQAEGAAGPATACQGGGRKTVLALSFGAGKYTLTAPAAYGLAIRQQCTRPDTEVACAAPTEAPIQVGLSSPAADQNIFVIVEHPAEETAFELVALAAADWVAPIIHTATWDDGQLIVTGSDINGDAETLGLSWLAEETVISTAERPLSPSALGQRMFTSAPIALETPRSATTMRLRLRDRQAAWSAPFDIDLRPDLAAMDAGITDAGIADAGVAADVGIADAGVADAGEVDASESPDASPEGP
jgi:hypothetical protein